MGRSLAQDSSVCWDSGISGLTWVTDAALQTLTQAIDVGGVGSRGAGSTQCARELPTSLLQIVTCRPEGSLTQDGGGGPQELSHHCHLQAGVTPPTGTERHLRGPQAMRFVKLSPTTPVSQLWGKWEFSGTMRGLPGHGDLALMRCPL